MDYMEQVMDPAYEDTGMIIKVPLQFLLDNIVYSCDFYDMTKEDAWLELVSWKASDSGFGHLVESILKRGFIRESPIGIQYTNGTNDWGGDQGGIEGLYISEGHHRLTAALLLCEDEVWISHWGRGADVNGKRISAHYHPKPYPIELD